MGTNIYFFSMKILPILLVVIHAQGDEEGDIGRRRERPGGEKLVPTMQATLEVNDSNGKGPGSAEEGPGSADAGKTFHGSYHQQVAAYDGNGGAYAQDTTEPSNSNNYASSNSGSNSYSNSNSNSNSNYNTGSNSNYNANYDSSNYDNTGSSSNQGSSYSSSTSGSTGGSSSPYASNESSSYNTGNSGNNYPSSSSQYSSGNSGSSVSSSSYVANSAGYETPGETETYNPAGYNGAKSPTYNGDGYESSYGLTCWKCHASSFEECEQYGYEQECQSNEEACELEIRERSHHRDHARQIIQINMGCKQKMACDNNQAQNFQNANPDYTQCRPEAEYLHSVCRQCCTENNCVKEPDWWYPLTREEWAYTEAGEYSSPY